MSLLVGDRTGPSPASPEGAGLARMRRAAIRPGIFGREMMREISALSALALVGLSFPVILVSLDSHLPSFALSLDRLWRMIFAISCMILVHTIPVVAAMAIVWTYARFLSEGVIVTLFAAGRSTFGAVLPAFLVTAFAVALAYLMSTVVAPGNARHIHDTMLFLRRDMNLGILDAGAFHHFANEKTTIYFARKVDKNHFVDIFITKKTDDDPENPDKEEAYFAHDAYLIGGEGTRALMMLDGSAIVSKKSEDGQQSIVFEKAVWRPDSGFGEPSRAYVFYDELDTGKFLQAAKPAEGGGRPSGSWLGEAIKRFVFPLLSVVYTVFGLGLLFVFAPATGRSHKPYVLAALICAVIFPIHIAYVYVIELTTKLGMFGVSLVLFGILAQVVTGLALLSRAQSPRLHSRALAASEALFDLALIRRIREAAGPADEAATP